MKLTPDGRLGVEQRQELRIEDAISDDIAYATDSPCGARL
jgi:hypothetical protein